MAPAFLQNYKIERLEGGAYSCLAMSNSTYMPLWVLAASASLSPLPVQADNFAGARYDPVKDQLVVTMVYRGSNPDHVFSLHWGQCNDQQGADAPDLSVEILDSQWQDAAQRDFKKTTRFDLSDIPCRPAKVTIRSAPRFFYTVSIPGKAASN
jgi:hypothetical protein